MTARIGRHISKTAAAFFEKSVKVALNNARRPHRATLTCRYSPNCFDCPLADCAVELKRAEVTNMI